MSILHSRNDRARGSIPNPTRNRTYMRSCGTLITTLAFAFAGIPSMTLAASTTSNLSVTASVISVCVNSVQSFRSGAAKSSGLKVYVLIKVACSIGTPFSIRVDTASCVASCKHDDGGLSSADAVGGEYLHSAETASDVERGLTQTFTVNPKWRPSLAASKSDLINLTVTY